MNYYIADTHFGHVPVLKYDGRPFETIEENDRVLIENWNARVTDKDHIYIFGGKDDACYRRQTPDLPVPLPNS